MAIFEELVIRVSHPVLKIPDSVWGCLLEETTLQGASLQRHFFQLSLSTLLPHELKCPKESFPSTDEDAKRHFE